MAIIFNFISFTKQYLQFGFTLQQKTSINTTKSHNLCKSSVCSMFKMCLNTGPTSSNCYKSKIEYATTISKSTKVRALFFDLTYFGLIFQHGCMVSCYQNSCLMLSIHQSRLVSTSSVNGLCVKVFHVKPQALCIYAYVTLRKSTWFLFVCPIGKILGVKFRAEVNFSCFFPKKIHCFAHFYVVNIFYTKNRQTIPKTI